MAHVYRDIPGAGTRLQLLTGGSATYTDIPGATEISWDGFKRGVRNPTMLISPAIVKKPGMTDFGQLKCKVYYDPNDTVHQEIVTRLTESAGDASAALDTWKLVYADGFATPANIIFIGFVSEFGMASGDAETGTMTADMTIEVTNVTSFNAGAPTE